MVLPSFIGLGILKFVGLFYPSFQTYKCLKRVGYREDDEGKQDNREDLQVWTQFWIVSAIYTILEWYFLDTFFSWLPLYLEGKILFLCWLVLPTFQGSRYIYVQFIEPLYGKYESEIEDINQVLRDSFTIVAAKVLATSYNYAKGSSLSQVFNSKNTNDEALSKSAITSDDTNIPVDSDKVNSGSFYTNYVYSCLYGNTDKGSGVPIGDVGSRSKDVAAVTEEPTPYEYEESLKVVMKNVSQATSYLPFFTRANTKNMDKEPEVKEEDNSINGQNLDSTTGRSKPASYFSQLLVTKQQDNDGPSMTNPDCQESDSSGVGVLKEEAGEDVVVNTKRNVESNKSFFALLGGCSKEIDSDKNEAFGEDVAKPLDTVAADDEQCIKSNIIDDTDKDQKQKEEQRSSSSSSSSNNGNGVFTQPFQDCKPDPNNVDIKGSLETNIDTSDDNSTKTSPLHPKRSIQSHRSTDNTFSPATENTKLLTGEAMSQSFVLDYKPHSSPDIKNKKTVHNKALQQVIEKEDTEDDDVFSANEDGFVGIDLDDGGNMLIGTRKQSIDT